MLRGERVVLRPVEERDLDALARWRNDPQVIDFLFSPFFVNPGGQEAWHASLLSNPDKVMFMSDDLQGVSIGALRVDRIDWRNQECELRPFFFDPEKPSAGYGKDAVKLLTEYAFEQLNMNRIYGLCFPHNRVITLAKSIGFKEEGVLRQAVFSGGRFHDKVVIGLLRDEWRERIRSRSADADG